MDGIAKRFGSQSWVLQHVSLRIARAERVVLLGESGVGKSTLLNIAAGLERPDRGRIFINGQDLSALDDDAIAALRRRELGFAFQAFHLLAHLTALQNVMVPLLLIGQPRDAAHLRAAQLLERLGLAARFDALPETLSGGEQQRVALARALAPRPSLVLADEPTGNLDPTTAASALQLLADHCKSEQAALLMVTHSEQAATIADRRLRLTATGMVDA